MSDAGAKLIADAINGAAAIYLIVSVWRLMFGGDKR